MSDNKEKPAEGAAATTPSGITLSQDELNHIKEQTRQEERSKLQSRLEKAASLEEKVQLMERDKQQIEQERNTLKSNYDTLQKSIKGDTSVDIPKLVEEVTKAARTKTEAEIRDRMVALESRITAIDAENSRLKLDSYRSKRLAQAKEAGENFIAELVTGNSPEEIEASLLKASETYKQYFGAGKVPAATAPKQTQATGPTPVIEPSAQAMAHAAPAAPLPAGKEGILDVVKGLVKGKAEKKQKLFLENRDELLAAAEEEAAQANVLVQ